MEESEIIDNYILGNLKGDDLIQFVEKLYADPVLAQKVKIRKAIIQGIEAIVSEELKIKLIDHDRKMERTKRFSNWTIKRIAAVAILLVAFGSFTVFFQHKYSRSKYSKFDLPEIGLPNKMSADNSNTQFVKAMNEFKLKNYKSASIQFGVLLEKQPVNDTLLYFTGISAYRTGDFQKGIVNFSKILLYEKSNFYSIAQYRLGLCYLSEGDKDKAKELFTLIANNPNHKYAVDSQKVLKYFY